MWAPYKNLVSPVGTPRTDHGFSYIIIKASYTILVPERRGPKIYKALKLIYFPDHQLIDGGVVSLNHRSTFPLRKIHDAHFCKEASSTTAPQRIKKI
jgi:hypothetical protein